MTAGVRLGRAVAHGWAVLLGYPWRQCAACGNSFGGQEQPTTEHLETIPGGEDDHRLLCPSCVDSGVGCRAHATSERPFHHDGCEHVPDEVWPADDTDTVPGRSGPYLMVMSRERPPSPFPRTDSKETVNPIITVLPEPAVVEKLAGRAAQRRIRAVGERSRILAAHKDMLATVPDVDNNAALLDLLREHAPVFVEAEDRLVCRGCAPSEPLTEDKEYPVRLADGPCPTWSTIHAHFEKRTA
ncbi:hypothetical protein [Amycolatopsis sp. NPDC049159]|uniref:hypothetical protein n=1 Tax=Amycolatopsis sp. NPDC049159 TaxID=3157210 RepID=UPI0033C11559